MGCGSALCLMRGCWREWPHRQHSPPGRETKDLPYAVAPRLNDKSGRAQAEPSVAWWPSWGDDCASSKAHGTSGSGDTGKSLVRAPGPSDRWVMPRALSQNAVSPSPSKIHMMTKGNDYSESDQILKTDLEVLRY